MFLEHVFNGNMDPESIAFQVKIPQKNMIRWENNFWMRNNVMSFNLSGRGCSAGIISVGLAKDLWWGCTVRNTLALIVSTETLHLNCYTGKNQSMLLTNCLFRMGSAAMYYLAINKTYARQSMSYNTLFKQTKHRMMNPMLVSFRMWTLRTRLGCQYQKV